MGTMKDDWRTTSGGYSRRQPCNHVTRLAFVMHFTRLEQPKRPKQFATGARYRHHEPSQFTLFSTCLQAANRSLDLLAAVPHVEASPGIPALPHAACHRPRPGRKRTTAVEVCR